ncbi:hypothetical protein NFJ02_32g81810 [Pycnococcus provasolii]
MFYVRELVGAGRFSFYHIPGIHNPADMLTKPLDGSTIRHLKRTLRSWGGDVAVSDSKRQTGTSTPIDPSPKRQRRY